MTEKIKIRRLPPVWFINIINGFRRSLLWLNRKMFPANVVLYEHFQNFWLLPCLKVAAELDIAAILEEGAKPVEEIATRVNAHPESLNRLLRALASQGVFKQGKDKRFANTAMSKVLIEGKGSLRHMILQHLGRVNWTVLSELSHSVKTGEDAFTKVFGKRIYDYLADHAEESAIFDKSMSNLTELAIEPVLSAYDFSGFKTIADIGGGEGLLLASILFKNPDTAGILFDLPAALNNATGVFEKFGVSNRVTGISGNFLESAPEGADLYLLKNIIHNWSDSESLMILSNIRKVMPPNGKILIIEMVIEEDNRPSFGKLIDIQMMVFMRSGKERTRKEFYDMLGKAGLKINRIVPTVAPISIIEAIKK